MSASMLPVALLALYLRIFFCSPSASMKHSDSLIFSPYLKFLYAYLFIFIINEDQSNSMATEKLKNAQSIFKNRSSQSDEETSLIQYFMRSERSKKKEDAKFKQHLASIYGMVNKMFAYILQSSDNQSDDQETKATNIVRPLMKDFQIQVKPSVSHAGIQTVEFSQSSDSGSVEEEISNVSESRSSYFFGQHSSIAHVNHTFREESLISQMNSFKFTPRRTHYLQKFKIIGQSFEYFAEAGKLTQVISDSSIPKDKTTKIMFKIVHSPSMALYLGLGKTTRLTQSHSAKAKDSSTISFAPTGKKRFYVLTSHIEPKKLPTINNGDVIGMVVRYLEGEILWTCNSIEMDVIKVNLTNSNWYPFLTLKCKGDIVEIL